MDFALYFAYVACAQQALQHGWPAQGHRSTEGLMTHIEGSVAQCIAQPDPAFEELAVPTVLQIWSECEHLSKMWCALAYLLSLVHETGVPLQDKKALQCI
jgi:hypothetical protein